MLYLFDDDALRELLKRKDIQPFTIPPIDHTLETLDLYYKLWETCLQLYFKELKRQARDNPYMTQEERGDLNLLYDVHIILTHLKETADFARDSGQLEDLKSRLKYLAEYGDKESRCLLRKDFAPHSFAFVVQKKVDRAWAPWFNGGLIYHGKHDNGGDGGAPTYSVNLTPQSGWAVHT